MKYILGVFGVIVLLILVVILIVRSGPDKPVGDVETGKRIVALSDYETKPAVASLTTRGEITADEGRRAIRISVSSQERVIEILEGYGETVVSRQTFPNTQSAYKVFLSALASAGFNLEKETTIKDERGVCPFGRRYVYKLQDGSDQVLRTWNTNCRREQGNFGGNGRSVRKLFENQIPDYRKLTSDVEL